MPRTRKNPGDDAPRIFRTKKNWRSCRPPSASATAWSMPAGAITPTTTSPPSCAKANWPSCKAEVQAKMQEVLRALVIDTDSDHNTQETAKRVAKMYLEEVFRGRYVPMPAVTEFPNAERLNELMIVGPDHRAQRLQPPHVPDLRQGLDRHPAQRAQQPDRPEQVRAHRRLGDEPAADPGRGGDDAGQRTAGARAPDGLAIVMEADHFCMHWRGVKDTDTAMVNSVMRGAFLKDANLRREFLSLLPRKTA
jgi:GTP cyclohydrolase I